MYDILQQILQNHHFLMTQNFETQGCEWYVVKRINLSLDEKNSGKRSGLGNLFVITSSSYFSIKSISRSIPLNIKTLANKHQSITIKL